MIIFAVIGGFAVGIFVGCIIVYIFALSEAWYKSKRECRECLRTRVEYGFHVDGKEYRCVEKEGGAIGCA